MNFQLDKRIDSYTKFVEKYGESKITVPRIGALSFFKGLDKFKYNCIKEDKLNETINIKTMKKSDNKNSDVLFAKDFSSGARVAVKKIPLDSQDLYFLSGDIDASSVNDSESDVLTEIFFLKLTTFLLLKKVCNFLPFLYRYYICNDCKFYNARIIKKFKKSEIPCLYLLTERATQELEFYLKRKAKTEKEYLGAYLQIYTALYVIKKYFNIQHQDLHVSNVLYFNVKKGGYWKYIVGKKVVYIPCYGAQFMLWDFAFSIIPDKVYTTSNLKEFKNEKENLLEDHKRILGPSSEVPRKFANVHKKLKDIIKTSTTPLQILNKVYKELLLLDPLPPKSEINVIETFNTNKKLNFKF